MFRSLLKQIKQVKLCSTWLLFVSPNFRVLQNPALATSALPDSTKKKNRGNTIHCIKRNWKWT